jgi:NADH dehydrogenase
LRRAPVNVTLVDRRNFHLFQPLLYQVATGALSPGEIASPLRSVLRGQRNTEVLLAEVTGFDVPGRQVLLQEGVIAYDMMVVATGARHHYFGHDEWEKFAPGLKTIEDATEIRRRILFAFEAAEREPDADARRAWLTFLIVGGGPTGVELAGALGEIANDTLKGDFRNIRPEEARILLLDASDRILSAYPADLSASAEEQLIRLGVRTLTRVAVTEVDEYGVKVRHGSGAEERIDARTVLWAAGVKASNLGAKLAAATSAGLDKIGRLIVEPDLTLPNHPEIFVIGDLAQARDEQGAPLPGVAPVAMQEGRYVGRFIARRLEGQTTPPFHYRDKGSLATIGRAAAVADFGRVHLEGLIAWIGWLFIHLMYLVGFQNRLLVLVRWAFAYFTHNRGARLITGERGASYTPK